MRAENGEEHGEKGK